MTARPSRTPPERDGVGVVTVDDQATFRAAAREVIEATAGFTPIGEAASGQEALAVVDRCEPQLVLVDVRMPGMDGIETARQITTEHPEVLVVLVSIEDPPNLPSTAPGSGAAALVRKQDLRPKLLRDLWEVHGGDHRRARDGGNRPELG